jgi:hypothetical protein
MRESIKPPSHWSVRLAGSDADLQDLANCLKQGHTHVVKKDGAYFLESLLLDDLQEPALVSRKARELVNVISCVARVRRSIAKPIEFAGLGWTDSNGIWRQMTNVTLTWNIYNDITRLTEPGIFERCIELTLKNDVVRSTLDDLLEKWDFPRLRRIGETILLDLGNGDTGKGVQEVVKRRWASRADCDLFWQTVNYGDKRSQGAHSQLRGQSRRNPQNVIAAGEFLSDLIAKWLESKI